MIFLYFFKKKFIVTYLKNFFQQRDLNFFYGLSFFLHFYIFFFSKSIFIFQKWTKINVQNRLLQNNVGFSKNVDFYIINGQSNLKKNKRIKSRKSRK
jgi:hypothetical protein